MTLEKQLREELRLLNNLKTKIEADRKKFNAIPLYNLEDAEKELRALILDFEMFREHKFRIATLKQLLKIPDLEKASVKTD